VGHQGHPTERVRQPRGYAPNSLTPGLKPGACAHDLVMGQHHRGPMFTGPDRSRWVSCRHGQLGIVVTLLNRRRQPEGGDAENTGQLAHLWS